MKKSSNIKNTEYMKKRIVILSKLFVMYLIVGSSIAMADTGSSEQSKSLDVQKNVVDQKAASPSLESAPENPDFANYQNNEISSQTEMSLEGHKVGVIPSPVDFSYLSSISSVKASFPAYYDLRTLNKVTSVKDQGNAGTCWAFTTYGSLESGLKPGETWDFSENNIKNLLSSAYSEGFDRDANDGATHLQSTAYLARWSGPVDENDDPYDPYSVTSSQNLPIKKHVQNVFLIPNRKSSLDNDIIKQAVQNYGGIYTTMCYGSSYYSPDTYSYYYNGTNVLNHAVTIVGWNDSYDKEKFSTVPPGNGAFIVKNSWGTGWGDNGYFYISYYDSKIGKDNAVFTAETTNNYENIYQYDPLGWTSSLGYSNPTAWCANIFTAKSNESLKAVSFYTTDSNCNYQIYIYTDPSSGPINQSGPVLTKSGTATFAGYNTIPLGAEIQLTSGQKFSIALKLTNSAYNYPIAVERPISDWSSKAKANAGESFISSSGQTWADITSYTNYLNTNMCIKAFTDSRNADLPIANFSTNVSNGYAPLTVQFTDLSQYATGWNWNFGDGNNSTQKSPMHTYSAVGNYTVNLTVSNENGTASKIATINVSQSVLPPIFPGYTNHPTDPNQDGLYEDVNGNGMMDFDDVVAYYDNMDWIGENAQVALFDYNKNSIIDFDDVVNLYDMI